MVWLKVWAFVGPMVGFYLGWIVLGLFSTVGGQAAGPARHSDVSKDGTQAVGARRSEPSTVYHPGGAL